MLNIGEKSNRTLRGITLTGLLNVLSGFFGVIGPVNYSISPGVIASTGVASRFTLIPAGVGLMAFLPENALATFPIWLKPILGNGFVVGVITVLIMEHLIYTTRK